MLLCFPYEYMFFPSEFNVGMYIYVCVCLYTYTEK